MNQGRIWTVVKPGVGLPLLLGSVTVIALGVHYAVLTHTTWFADYWQGKAVKKADLNSSASVALVSQPGFVVSVAPAAVSDKGATSFVVTVAPASQNAATADADTSATRLPDRVASADINSR